MSQLHAVILAGGQGTRLRPYTTSLPKPLVPIGDDCAILEIVMRQLERDGFRRVTIAIGHLGELIRAYVGTGVKWGMEVDYADEEKPLGTIGPVIAILDRLPDQFLVMNGDILTDLPYRDLLAHHERSGAPMTVATCAREVKVDFGVIEATDGHVVGFKEKPTLAYSVSMGVYALSRETLAGYPSGEPIGFDRLVLDLLRAGTLPAVFPFAGYWLDIGRPDDYDRANLEFPDQRGKLLPER